jgi:hypothetical protein
MKTLSAEEYIPYGPEWQKEMSKFNKAHLIAMLSDKLQLINQFENDLKDFCLVVNESPLASTEWFQKMKAKYNPS